MFNKSIDRRGTVGETVTWMVATLIILVILIFSITISGSHLGRNKGVEIGSQDILASKSFYSYLLTEDENGEIVYEQIKKEADFNNFTGELAVNIFKEFYREEYKGIWLGIVAIMSDTSFPYSANTYFGGRDTTLGGVGSQYISEKIHLNESKSLELLLIKKEGAPTLQPL